MKKKRCPDCGMIEDSFSHLPSICESIKIANEERQKKFLDDVRKMVDENKDLEIALSKIGEKAGEIDASDM